ncbi:solute carrier family 2, facilitated glucose transporter member 5 isoform X2 [Talpa occidentalis]|uniref:solute carrier family 2, facilitated glucose transporter member 5 isoform X2 n=1 Tax=Talpa occidentalis TaxID=50954 RepID=UPI0018904E76|nr:solute carrier family 2, facilitated glucose transporter member 5 isoform X2 [Talpa occidentalis]
MKETEKKGRLTRVLALTTLIAAFGSSFQYGYNVSSINSPSEIMKEFYNETFYDRTSDYLSEFSLTLLWSVSVSMFPFGGLVGSFLVGPMVNNLGRKGTLLLNNIFSIVSSILMGCSETAKSFEMIIVARFLVGICAGWPILLGLTGVPAGVQLLLLPFSPESPRYLLIQKKDEKAARKALRELRGWDDVEDEIQEIREEDEAEKAAGFISVLKLFQTRSLRWQVVSIIVLMAGQQLSGVNAIFYYTDQVFRSAGVETDHIQYVTVSTGTVNMLITICAVFVVEYLGRRFLLLLGFFICFAACCVLTVALALQDTVSWMPYLSIACVFSYVVGHALGPSPIPALLTMEIFLQSSRASAYVVGGSVHWLSNFIVGLVFPFIQEALKSYSFIIFAVVCLLTTIYTFFIIPETKGKTFMEINQIFTKRNKVPDMYPDKEELNELPPATLEQN